MSRQKGTKTSAFGSPGRESHDSSLFYDSRLYRDAPRERVQTYQENEVESSMLDQVILGSSEDMGSLPDRSVHMMVTSPPYNVRKEYDDDLTLKEYMDLLARVFGETYRVLVTGGRACVNVANIGRKPYIPLAAHISSMMTDLGFLMRGEIIWDKAASVGASTAWGSWISATNPTLRDVHEYILVFSKGSYRRAQSGRVSTISRDEFLEFTKSVWTFPTERAQRIGHPAPFPVELPYRLIQLYTFQGEIVLDPFLGSGTTAIAARDSGRRFIGYEVDPAYAELAKQRLAAVESK